MADNHGEYKVLIVVVVFLLIFIFLVNSLISETSSADGSGWWTYQNYSTNKFTQANPPVYFSLSALGNQTYRSSQASNITGEQTVIFGISNLASNDTQISVSWLRHSIGLSYTNLFQFYHQEHHSILFGLIQWDSWVQMNPLSVDYTYIENNAVSNVTTWSEYCSDNDIPHVTCQMTFDKTLYSSFDDALKNGHVALVVGYLGNSTWTMKVNNVVDFLAYFLSFNSQAIAIDPTINYIIAVPVWVAIMVSTIYVIYMVVKNWL